jgi:hypothetical protein
MKFKERPKEFFNCRIHRYIPVPSKSEEIANDIQTKEKDLTENVKSRTGTGMYGGTTNLQNMSITFEQIYIWPVEKMRKNVER